MDAYIARLKRETAARRAERVLERASGTYDPRAKLKAHIVQWYSSLTPEALLAHYFMEHLARQLRATPQELGIALRDLGWRCERRWCKGEPYRHYWVPPAIPLI